MMTESKQSSPLSSAAATNMAAATDAFTSPATVTASQQPMKDAVASAVDGSNTQTFDPQLIAQITESVLQQLRLTNAQQSVSGPQHDPQVSRQTSADLPVEGGVRSAEQPKNNSPEPAQAQNSTPSSPRKRRVSFDETAKSPAEPGRPSVQRMPSALPEETPLERTWGRLFDEHGDPTVRLNQLLRGVATHLIEDVEPKGSLVVTPEKMVEYYRRAKLDKEIYPWEIVCDDRLTYVSRMYRGLHCQHHLVQENHEDRPDVPGLTPSGFAHWVGLMLRAHPDEEYERLKKVILIMPISNPDDRSERFPKDISRRLFRPLPDFKTRNTIRRAMIQFAESAEIEWPDDEEAVEEKVDESISDSGKTARRRSSSTEYRRHQDRTHAVNGASHSMKTEPRRPYMPTVGADGVVIPDDEHLATTQPIERERKPYTVSLGGGRVFDDAVFVQPAGARHGGFYPSKASSVASNSTTGTVPYELASAGPPSPVAGPPHPSSFPLQGSTSPTRLAYPPPPPPPPPPPGPVRSNSSSSRTRSYVPPTIPTSAPSGNVHSHAPPTSGGPEIHQSFPPPSSSSSSQQRVYRSSTTRRRAPSGSQGFSPAADGGSFAPISFDGGRQPVYVDRAGGHDGYGAYGDEGVRPRRRDSEHSRDGSRRESPRSRGPNSSRGYSRDEDYYRY